MTNNNDLSEPLNLQKEFTKLKTTIKQQSPILKIQTHMINSIDQPIYAIDTDYRYILFNQAHVARMKARYNADIALGENFLHYLLDIEIRQKKQADFDFVFKGTPLTLQKTDDKDKPTQKYKEVIYYPIMDANTCLGIITMVQDITKLKFANAQLKKISVAIEQNPISIVITDKSGSIEYVNPKFSELTGYTFNEALGQNPRILQTNLTPPETYTQLWNTISAGKDWSGEFVNKKKNGELYYEFAKISPIVDENDKITHYVAMKEDITQRKLAEDLLKETNQKLQAQMSEIKTLHKKLEEQAIRDSLTGLFNQHFMQETLDREIIHAKRKNHSLGLIMLDLDNFKQINDTFGHIAGDLVLEELTKIIRNNIRVDDIPCRYGGDEIIIIMPDISKKVIEKRAIQICKAVESLTISLDKETIHSTISIGVVLKTSMEYTKKQLIDFADKALYQAKYAGRNQVAMYQDLKK